MLKDEGSLVQSRHREFRVTHILHNLLYAAKNGQRKTRNFEEKFSKRKYERADLLRGENIYPTECQFDFAFQTFTSMSH